MGRWASDDIKARGQSDVGRYRRSYALSVGLVADWRPTGFQPVETRFNINKEFTFNKQYNYMDTIKIFISSTCYDLTDIRQMLSQFIADELRLAVSRSDDATDSAFDINDGLPAVESCLLNLERSDWVIFILDRRYGPPLGRLGEIDYGDRSATHVEMERAIALQKRMLLLVRSQLLALYDSHSKNYFDKQVDANNFHHLKPRWLMSKNDLRLFDLIKLYSGTNGWRESFTSYNDIKKLLWNQFRKYRYRADVHDRILRNEVPHLLIRLASWRQRPGGRINVAAQLANTTTQLAYNIRIRLDGEDIGGSSSDTLPQANFLAAGQTLDTYFTLPESSLTANKYKLYITYDFGICQEIEDTYNLIFRIAESSFYLENNTKTYYVGDGTRDPGPRVVFR